MGFAFKFCQRMIIAHQSDRLSIADVVDDVDGIFGFADSKTFAVENLLIAEGMEFGEAVAEFEFFAINKDGTVGSGSFF